mgnify:CR=1 FL=1
MNGSGKKDEDKENKSATLRRSSQNGKDDGWYNPGRERKPKSMKNVFNAGTQSNSDGDEAAGPEGINPSNLGTFSPRSSQDGPD